MNKILSIIFFIYACTVQAQIWTAADNCFSLQLYDTVTKKKYTYPKSQIQVHNLGSQLQLQRANPSPSIIASWTPSNVGLIAPTISQGYDLISGWLVNTCTLTSGGNDSLQNLILSGDTLSITGGNSVILPTTGGELWDTATIDESTVLFSKLLNIFDEDSTLFRSLILSAAGNVDIPAYLFTGWGSFNVDMSADEDIIGVEIKADSDTAEAISIYGNNNCKECASTLIKGDNSSLGGSDIELLPQNGRLRISNLNIDDSTYYILAIDDHNRIFKSTKTSYPETIFKREIWLDSSDILNLNTTPVVVLPAVDGSFHVLDKVYLYSDNQIDTIPYDFETNTVFIMAIDTSRILVTQIDSILNAEHTAVNLFSPKIEDSNLYQSFQLYESDFSLWATSVPTQGNRRLKVVIYYREFYN